MKAGLIVLLPALLFANERRFGYAVQTPVLPSGQAELEAWNTVRTGGGPFVWAIDQREELEVGLGAQTQASLYLDLKSESDRSPSGLKTSSMLDGFSLEIQHQFTDPAADALGTAVYTELGVHPDEIEWEGKILLDRTLGEWVLVANLVAEGEWGLSAPGEGKAGGTFSGLPLELDAGASYRFAERASAGLELRVHDALQKEDGAWQSRRVATYLGPTLSIGAERVWAALTILPQISTEQVAHQALEVRLLAGLHI